MFIFFLLRLSTALDNGLSLTPPMGWETWERFRCNPNPNDPDSISGYPGSEFHLEQDAQTFAEWCVDYLKFDGCNSDPKDIGYTAMGFFLNKTGRPIVYSCEWPFYQRQAGMKPNYAAIKKVCNLWRNLPDVDDSWDSIKNIITTIGEDKYSVSKYAQPGAWNDPDQLVIGDFGLIYEQSRVQMGMWAIMAAPLIMSNDLRDITTWAKDLLQNKHLLAINQDTLGHQGRSVLQKVNGTTIQIWSKPISPQRSFAIAFLQLENHGDRTVAWTSLKEIGLTNKNGYNCKDGFIGQDLCLLLKPETEFFFVIKPNSMEIMVTKPVEEVGWLC